MKSEYAVESDLPIAYSAVSSEHAHIVTNSITNLTVSLPLVFTVERIEMRGGGSDSYIVQTSPINVGPRVMGEEAIYDYYAYHDATNLCWGVLNDFREDRSKWQFYGATLLLPLPLSMDKQHREAYSIATNAIASLDVHGEVSVDTNVWMVLFSPESLQQGNMRMALRTLAAVALSHVDSAADISSYTNGLPAQALQVINDVRSDLCD